MPSILPTSGSDPAGVLGGFALTPYLTTRVHIHPAQRRVRHGRVGDERTRSLLRGIVQPRIDDARAPRVGTAGAKLLRRAD